MKHLLLITSLTFSAALAGAYNDDLNVVYLSWCDQQNVMQEDSSGRAVVRANCALDEKVCKSFETYKNRMVIFSAVCADKETGN